MLYVFLMQKLFFTFLPLADPTISPSPLPAASFPFLSSIDLLTTFSL